MPARPGVIKHLTPLVNYFICRYQVLISTWICIKISDSPIQKGVHKIYDISEYDLYIVINLVFQSHKNAC